MRNPNRRPRIIGLINEIWLYDPDARLCQIIGNALPGTEDKYYVEDDVLDEALTRLVERHRERFSDPG